MTGRRVWLCGMFRNTPAGCTLEACQPGNGHDDWTCGWAYEGSADYDEALAKWGHAVRKPTVCEA